MKPIFYSVLLFITIISCTPRIVYNTNGSSAEHLIDNDKMLFVLSYLFSISYEEDQEYWKDKFEVEFYLANRDKNEPIEITDIDVLIIQNGKNMGYLRIDTNFIRASINRESVYKTKNDFLLEKKIINTYISGEKDCDKNKETCSLAYI